MLAWYFAPPDNRLAYGDGREIRKGVTHYVNGAPEICQYGLHGSYRLIDALAYAHSSIVYRVRLGGWKDSRNGKCCAQSRTYLTDGIDIEDTLREFARQCALDVVGYEMLRTKDNPTVNGGFGSVIWSAVYWATRLAILSSANSETDSVADSAQNARLEQMVMAQIDMAREVSYE